MKLREPTEEIFTRCKEQVSQFNLLPPDLTVENGIPHVAVPHRVAVKFADEMWTSPASPMPVVLAVMAGTRSLVMEKSPVRCMSIALGAPLTFPVSAERVELAIASWPPRIVIVPAASAETSSTLPSEMLMLPIAAKDCPLIFGAGCKLDDRISPGEPTLAI